MSTRTQYSNWRTVAYRWTWASAASFLAAMAFDPSIAMAQRGGGHGGGGGGGGAHVGGGGGGGAHFGGGGVTYGGGGGVRMAAPAGGGVRMAAPAGGGVRMAAPAVRAPAVSSGATVHAPAVSSGLSARAPGVTAGTGINAGAAAGAHTAMRPTFGAGGTTAGTGAMATNRATWHTASPTQVQGVHTNLSNALATRNAATANTAATATARATAPGATAATTPTVSATGATNAGINPNRAAYWAGYGAAVRNSYLGGAGYGGLGYGGLGYAPFYGGNFWSGRNLIGMGLMSALGGGYGGYGLGGYGGYGLGGYGGYGLGGLGGYGGMGNWWGYSPWLGNQPYGYWYGNPGWNTFANYYGWQQPYYYDYGPNGNVVYQGSQVLVNGTPVGTADQYAQSAADLATVTPEEMNAPHDWMPLGTFSVATSTNDPKPVRVAQLAYDNKQGLISGTIFNQQSGNLYTIQGKVDPKTQRTAFTIGNDPNTVMETGLYNLTQNETPVLVHFGPEKTATYLFARLPEPKEGEQQAQTAAAPGPAPQGAPPAEDLRR